MKWWGFLVRSTCPHAIFTAGFIRLHFQKLNGTFPTELEDGLVKIEKLHLEDLQLTGSVPSFRVNFQTLSK